MEIFELGPLFHAVQLARVFDDDKTFVDCVPLRSLPTIAAAYAALPSTDPVALRRFVAGNFRAPADTHDASAPDASDADISRQIQHLWTLLLRPADTAVPDSSLLPLPAPYVVPGGRFREIYYWDSYFTMLGLRASPDPATRTLCHHLVTNFAHLIARHGHIPNGNRTYYLSRSQPPLFSLMAELLTALDPTTTLAAHRSALQAEYDYWMDRTSPTRHTLPLPDGSTLHRYWDQLDTPRPESYRHDVALTRSTQARPTSELYRDLRSAAESGWDFSSRWLAPGGDLGTIRTTRLIPVDLNCFLWHLETTLARACAAAGDLTASNRYVAAALARQHAILHYCWSRTDGFFCDYDLDTHTPSAHLTLAGVVPLFFGLATPAQAAAVARRLAADFLRPGGLVTTLRHTGQQWDSPNGWAPLQWLAVRGLHRYAHHALANEIARRWIDLNLSTYRTTGLFLEKYDVVEPTRAPAGGEYASQHGFGWTNGVLADLLRDHPLSPN